MVTDYILNAKHWFYIALTLIAVVYFIMVTLIVAVHPDVNIVIHAIINICVVALLIIIANLYYKYVLGRKTKPKGFSLE